MWRGPGRWLEGKRAHDKTAEPDGARATATSRRDHKLESRYMAESPVLCGAPRELDVPLLDANELPAGRELKIATVKPPDVLAACVDELDLQIVDRRFGPHPHRELEVLRQIERQRASCERITGGSREIEVEAQGAVTV